MPVNVIPVSKTMKFQSKQATLNHLSKWFVILLRGKPQGLDIVYKYIYIVVWILDINIYIEYVDI